MIFAKSAFSIQVRKKLDLGFFLEGQNREKSIENWHQKWFVLKHCILSVFGRFGLHFGGQKTSQNHKFSKKWKFQGVFWSTIAFELLFKRILKPLDFNVGWFSSFQEVFLGFAVAFAETCVGLFRLQNLLYWLGRRGADQWMDGWMDGACLVPPWCWARG